MFDWFPFIGDDDADSQCNTTAFDPEAPGSATVTGNHEAWGLDVTVGTGDPSGVLDAKWFESQTLRFEQNEATDAPGATEPSRRHEAVDGVTTDELGSHVVDPPSSAPTIRDTDPDRFGLPLQPQFVRQMELAAKNGAHERVETGYVLAGMSETVPNVLFGLDDRCLYLESTDRALNPRIRSIARRVAAAYPAAVTPDLLVWIHTHPHNEEAQPSEQDTAGNDELRDCFVEAFEADSFKFLQGIHAYATRSGEPTLGYRHQPTADGDAFLWAGEQYTHTLRVWDYRFQQPLQPEVITRA